VGARHLAIFVCDWITKALFGFVKIRQKGDKRSGVCGVGSTIRMKFIGRGLILRPCVVCRSEWCLGHLKNPSEER